MKEFEFASSGIMVVFCGDDFFLSESLLAEFEDRYVGRVSEYTLGCMLAMAQNVEAVRHQAEEKGETATFGTITSWLSSQALERERNRRNWIRGMCLYRRKLVKLTGAKLVWVNEFGRKGGRLHGHFAADRSMDLDLMEEAKILCRYPLDVELGGEMVRVRMEAWGLVGRCHIKALGAPDYLWKELGKSVGRRGLGFKLMGTLGEFKGRCGVRDFVLDSPMAECRRLAVATRVTGEPLRLVWERAREHYGAWSAGKLDLGPKYDRWRGRISGGGGDAWEDEGGETDFDVEKLEQ